MNGTVYNSPSSSTSVIESNLITATAIDQTIIDVNYILRVDVTDSRSYTATAQFSITASGITPKVDGHSNGKDITSKNLEKDIPTTYGLAQNYPNPFNPSTTIYYQLPKDGFISLKVFDIVGNEVKTLVNGYRSAGNYSINFDASNLSSGIYFYQIKTNNYFAVKKMMLLK